jgi:hypothetical protein
MQSALLYGAIRCAALRCHAVRKLFNNPALPYVLNALGVHPSLATARSPFDHDNGHEGHE